MTLSSSEDTIVALASGRGAAGIAVIRLSGSNTLPIVSEIFRPAGNVNLSANRLTYGTLTNAAGEPLDDCMAVIMPAPHSFTGEDVAEIQCHGSLAVVSAIIDRCIERGARVADPGEYSRRAFLNGKMDLAQAEALTDLISSRSEAARRLALRQLRGGLSKKLQDFNSNLLDAAAEIEAHIDFPDEDIPEMARDRILGRLNMALAGMERLLAGHDKARVKTEGARVILAGEPNAGKSSLFNALVGRERAIVSPHPGTTRDTIEAVVEIGGLAITLVDTAGIREGAEEIEQIGIDRTHEEIREADLVLHLLDGSENTVPVWPEIPVSDPGRVIHVLTKADQAEAESTKCEEIVSISSATGAGLGHLENKICSHLVGNEEDDSDVEMSRVRHAKHLRSAIGSAKMARSTFESGESGDLVMVDLRDALASIGEITGDRLDEQILDRIFSTFCLGK